jgi:spore germination cell wall hydrolase CwlJ-like protein
MVGATALGSVMGLTFSGAYLAGGMAHAAVATTPGSEAEVSRLASSWSSNHKTTRIEIGSVSRSSRHGAGSVFGPAERAGFTALSASYDKAPTSVEDSASKRQAFGQTYNVAESAGFPQVDTVSEYSLRKSNRELDCLTSALYYEARGEGQAGMEAVAQVIVNRARHPDFPKSLCGVIYQGAGRGRGCQFSFACDGSMRRRTEAALWDRARTVAERAMEGRVSQAVGTSTFFHATRISPGWRGLTRVATVGRHVFYRHAGARGSGANFLRGQVGDFGGGVELAAATSRARVYKVASAAPASERSAPTVRASYRAATETIAPYAIARVEEEEVTISNDSQPTETISLDAIVDAAVTSS